MPRRVGDQRCTGTPTTRIIIVQEGQATAVVGDAELQVQAGDIVLIPANRAHGFVNSGNAPLRQIDIHPNPRFVTEWLTEQKKTGTEQDSELG